MKTGTKILRYIRKNHPNGCEAIMICNFCLFDEHAGKKERAATYKEIKRLCKMGLLGKKYEGFYILKGMMNSRRYYIHSRVKKYFNMDARKRHVDYSDKINIPPSLKLQLLELSSIGYNIQHTIL